MQCPPGPRIRRMCSRCGVGGQDRATLGPFAPAGSSASPADSPSAAHLVGAGREPAVRGGGPEGATGLPRRLPGRARRLSSGACAARTRGPAPIDRRRGSRPGRAASVSHRCISSRGPSAHDSEQAPADGLAGGRVRRCRARAARRPVRRSPPRRPQDASSCDVQPARRFRSFAVDPANDAPMPTVPLAPLERAHRQPARGPRRP